MKKLIAGVVLFFVVGCGNNPVQNSVPFTKTVSVRFDVDTSTLNKNDLFNPIIYFDELECSQIFDTSVFNFVYSKPDSAAKGHVCVFTKYKFSKRLKDFGAYGRLRCVDSFYISNDTVVKVPNKKICKVVVKNSGSASRCMLILKNEFGNPDTIMNGYYSGMYPIGRVVFYPTNDTLRVDTLRVFEGDKIYSVKNYHNDSTLKWYSLDSNQFTIKTDTALFFQ